MSYCEIVENTEVELGGAYKQAMDIARILDSEPLKKGDRYGGGVGVRKEAFDIFCAILNRANLELPPIEEELWRSDLPKHYSKPPVEGFKKKTEYFRNQLRGIISGTTPDPHIERATKLLEAIETIGEELGGFNGVKFENLIAMINSELNVAGADVLRPDYSNVDVPKIIHSVGPSSSMNVLVVDDMPEEITRTALALSGIPNLNVEFLVIQEGESWEKFEGEKLQAAMERSAKRVVDMKPDVIFMDQMMGSIKGHELIGFIKDHLKSEDQLVFIGNTGGTDDELRSAGCRGNFNKGNDQRVVRDVINALNSK
ncbi:hypothetical protein ACFL2R_02950 [Patescibacteria group bacterium]